MRYGLHDLYDRKRKRWILSALIAGKKKFIKAVGKDLKITTPCTRNERKIKHIIVDQCVSHESTPVGSEQRTFEFK